MEKIQPPPLKLLTATLLPLSSAGVLIREHARKPIYEPGDKN
jgi:hypothetical protein